LYVNGIDIEMRRNENSADSGSCISVLPPFPYIIGGFLFRKNIDILTARQLLLLM